ncbi:MAG: nucleotidyltransferase domain-containing protein [Pseudomonadota bacterium]
MATVQLYGSRANGNFHRGSDDDLSIIGEQVSQQLLLHIETEIDDLSLPYKIDLSLFHHIDNSDLIGHIKRVGQVFYQK